MISQNVSYLVTNAKYCNLFKIIIYSCFFKFFFIWFYSLRDPCHHPSFPYSLLTYVITVAQSFSNRYKLIIPPLIILLLSAYLKLQVQTMVQSPIHFSSVVRMHTATYLHFLMCWRPINSSF